MTSWIDKFLAYDLQLLLMINTTWTHPLLDYFFPWVTDLHKTWPFKIIAPIVILFFSYKYYARNFLYVFMTILIGVGLSDFTGNQIFKKNIVRDRPHISHPEIIKRSPSQGRSFISNHTTNMFCLATLLLFFFGKRFGIFYIVALIVGYSRMYNGAHYPSDIFVGALWGIMVATLVYKTATLICKKRFVSYEDSNHRR